MKQITLHHDGHGRMERLLVLATDEVATDPPGNSSHHRYEFFVLEDPVYEWVLRNGAESVVEVWDLKPRAVIQFQSGPFGAEGSTSGTLGNAVIAALVDHFQGFQSGPDGKPGCLANRQTALAITKLQEALFWLRDRADERAARDVLGSMSK